MSIDTALKRRSVAGRVARTPGVTPDAAKPVAWRQAVAREYAGSLNAVIAPLVHTYGVVLHTSPRVTVAHVDRARLVHTKTVVLAMEEAP